MSVKYLISFFLLTGMLFAETTKEEASFSDLVSGISSDYLVDTSENAFSSFAPDLSMPQVDPYSGYLSQQSCDLVVAGAQPLSVLRHYFQGPYEARTGNWNFHRRTYVGGNLEWKMKKKVISLGTNGGGVISLVPSQKGWTFEKTKGWCHFSQSGQTHPDNVHFSYYRITDQKNKERFLFKGEVREGDGSVRYFASKLHAWHSSAKHKVKKLICGGLAGNITTYVYSPAVWTPYELHDSLKPSRGCSGQTVSVAHLVRS